MINQEYNLTIMDIKWENGNVYETNEGIEVEVIYGELYLSGAAYYITEELPLETVLEMRFRKIIDWSKVPVDTKILVRNSEDYAWKRRYFAKYEDGKIYAWLDGTTSWSAKYHHSWEYAKLATEEE